jgi:hypothetical protein
MKKLIILWLLVFPFVSKAQVGEEIRTFIDSTEFYMDNGRRLLMQTLQEDNINKVLEIQTFLDETARRSSYNAFSYGEELCLAMLTNQWETAEKIIAAYEDLRYPDYPVQYSILTSLYTMLKENHETLSMQCENSTIDNEVKAILKLLIYYVNANKVSEEYYKRLDNIYLSYKPLAHEAFLEGFLPKRKIYGSMGIALGGGATMPNGGFGNYYKPGGDFFLTIDGKVKQAYFAFAMHSGNMKLMESFEIELPFEGTFNEGYKFSYLNVGGRFGYLMLRNKYFHLAPYAQISYSGLYSDEFDSESEEEEYYDMNAFSVGPGIHAEIKLFEFEDNTYGYYGNTTMHAVSLMFGGGYNFNLGFARPEIKGNSIYFDAAMVVRFGGM